MVETSAEIPHSSNFFASHWSAVQQVDDMHGLVKDIGSDYKQTLKLFDHVLFFKNLRVKLARLNQKSYILI